MSWEDINNQILEINEQIQSFSRRQLEIYQLAKIIKDRQQKLDRHENIRILNDAVLENKMIVTSIQTLLLMKLNELSLSDDMNEIYQNIPNSLEECSVFLTKLAEKYHFGERIINLLEGIEKLSEIEYSNDLPCEETEYAKLIIFEDNMLEEILSQCIMQPLLTNSALLESLVSSKINMVNEYLNNLPLEKRTELFLQSVKLSYNKNAFIFIQKYKTIQKICKGIIVQSLLENLYDLFHRLLENGLLATYENMRTEELLSNFNIDLENILTQELKAKKKV